MKISDVMHDVYARLDSAVAKAIDHHDALPASERPPGTGEVSCRKGCSHCCGQLTMISLAEGVTIAETILTDTTRDWRTLLPALRAVAIEDCRPGLTRRSRFGVDVPCALLDANTKLCTVYESRPSCCRFLVVVTPPELCSVTANGAKTCALDLLDAEAAVWEVSSNIANDLGMQGLNALAQAPISIMVLAAMGMLLEPDDVDGGADLRLVLDATSGLPSPPQWMQNHIMDLGAEEDRNTAGDANNAAQQERLYAIGKRVFGEGVA
jgi:Fe-S-cluster containining protein